MPGTVTNRPLAAQGIQPSSAVPFSPQPGTVAAPPINPSDTARPIPVTSGRRLSGEGVAYVVKQHRPIPHAAPGSQSVRERRSGVGPGRRTTEPGVILLSTNHAPARTGSIVLSSSQPKLTFLLAVPTLLLLLPVLVLPFFGRRRYY
jgi:hypothetical protein